MDATGPNKAGPDPVLAFSRITTENWQLPDRQNYMPFGVSAVEWPYPILEPKLHDAVPREVIRVFEVARAAVVYSWYFYPLATLGLEQCTRVAEFAARERCRLLQRDSDRFFENIETLSNAGILSPEQSFRWDAVRKLRNDRSHLKSFMLVDPGYAVGVLRTTVELINSLFPLPPSATS